MEPCECMTYQNESGDTVCRRCRGDWYGCDCPQVHSICCDNNPNKEIT